MTDEQRGLATIRPQNWETVASPGHVFYAKVDVLRLRIGRLYWVAFLLLLSIPLMVMASWYAGGKIGLGAGKLAGMATGVWLALKAWHILAASSVAAAVGLIVWLKLKRTVTVLAVTVLASGAAIGSGVYLISSLIKGSDAKNELVSVEAPLIKPIQYVLGQGANDRAEIKNTDQIRELMFRWGAELDAGRSIPAGDCVTDKKITDPWFGENDVKLRCRVSSDKTRVWVWGYAFSSLDPNRRYQGDADGGGFAAVLRKTKADGWTIANVTQSIPGASIYLYDLEEAASKKAAEAARELAIKKHIEGPEAASMIRIASAAARERFNVIPNRVPRAIAADFPELKIEKAAPVGAPRATLPAPSQQRLSAF